MKKGSELAIPKDMTRFREPVIPVRVAIQKKNTNAGCPRIKYGAGLSGSGMTEVYHIK